MQLALDDPYTDFIFGMTGNSVLAAPYIDAARTIYQLALRHAKQAGQTIPERTRTYHEVEYAVQSWPQAFQVILKAEVKSLGDNSRFVVTSLDLPSPEIV